MECEEDVWAEEIGELGELGKTGTSCHKGKQGLGSGYITDYVTIDTLASKANISPFEAVDLLWDTLERGLKVEAVKCGGCDGILVDRENINAKEWRKGVARYAKAANMSSYDLIKLHEKALT